MLIAPDDARSLPGPDWLRAARADAATRANERGLPGRGDEAWKYGRIAELDLARFAPAPVPAAAAVPAPLRSLLDAMGERAATVVIRNGHVVQVDVDERLTRRGVRVAVPGEGDRPIDREPTDDVFADLNEALAPTPLHIAVPAGVAIEAPVVVLQWVDIDGVVAYPRIVVDAGEQSQITIVDHSGSADVRALTVPVVDIRCADAANVRVLTIEDLEASVWQLGLQRSVVGAQANLVSSTVALGGDYARFRIDARLEGEGGGAELAAVYFGDGEQTHDFNTLQDHVGKRTTSDLLFKGAVAGKSRAVYTGLIRVNHGASGASALLTNRNVVLSDGARADSVPNLEIVNENDLKRCGHASATGPIDEDQLFYLESRGIPTAVAERLIVLGFFDDIFDRTPVRQLAEALRFAVARKFDEAAR